MKIKLDKPSDELMNILQLIDDIEEVDSGETYPFGTKPLFPCQTGKRPEPNMWAENSIQHKLL